MEQGAETWTETLKKWVETQRNGLGRGNIDWDA